jgi:hypothetical protein
MADEHDQQQQQQHQEHQEQQYPQSKSGHYVTFQLPQSLDKENVNWQRQAKVMTTKSPFKSPHRPTRVHQTPYSTPINTPFSTPARKHRAPFQSPDAAAVTASTTAPPGSSKLLRQHLQQMSTTPSKRRLVDSGALRSIDLKTQSRIGYDGTTMTPSKELLKSTTASRFQRVVAVQDDDCWSVSVDVSLDSTMMHHGMMMMMDDDHHHEHPQVPIMGGRNFQDPVALTLLNGGNEDYEMLAQLDISDDTLDAAPRVLSSLLPADVAALVRPVATRKH